MCHCFRSVDGLSEEERAETREVQTLDKSRAEYSGEELVRLGIAT